MNQKTPITRRPVADLVSKFIVLGANDVEVNRRGPAKSTKLKIDEHGISYTFTRLEVATLQALHEVTGVSIDWLAKDAIGWTRNYISDLTRRGTGELFDLIDIEDGGPCPVGKKNRARTRKFLAAVESGRGNLTEPADRMNRLRLAREHIGVSLAARSLRICVVAKLTARGA